MSTRSTVLSGPNFHLFTDMCDSIHGDDHYPPLIHLSLWGPELEYEVRNGRVTVAIPIAVWEAIRRKEVVNLMDVHPDETNRRLIAANQSQNIIDDVSAGRLFAELRLNAYLPDWAGGEIDKVALQAAIAAEYDREYAARGELARRVNALLGRQPDDELE